MKQLLLGVFLVAVTTTGCRVSNKSKTDSDMEKYPIERSEAEWRAQLSPEQYRILREKGTEYPGTGEYNLHFKEGTYSCAGCGAELFSSESKFDGHCGWPSFDAALAGGRVQEHRDLSHGMIRTEILCAQCGGHLGHVFPDGPTETGLRYCVNSLSLEFQTVNDSTSAK